MPTAEMTEPRLGVTDESGCWPTALQELILQAALLRGQGAVDAWTRWKAAADLDALDFGTHRMLPLVYSNLRSQGLSDPILEKFKSVYRYYWYNNEILLNRAAANLKVLHQAGIQTLVLKGAALIPSYYRQRGLRPMQDCDIAVPHHQAQRAIAVLRQLGWTSCWELPPEQFISIRHSAPFVNAEGHMLDLHWGILWECWNRNQDAGFWSRAIPVTIGDQSTLALEPTDQLLHIIWHGARWNEVPPLRWVADAMMVLRAPEVGIDWQRLLDLVEFHHLGLFVHTSLEFLRAKLQAPIPEFVLDRLQAMPVSPIERFGYRMLTEPLAASPTNKEILRVLRYEYLWLTSDLPASRKPLEFATWLQFRWKVDRRWKTPFILLANAARRMGRQLMRLARPGLLRSPATPANG
ncbi:MAG TPA: nucleotidyltransferase family protein [Terriglobales bacterium]|nr:nucleotidyltransferase family protein [Terriglobales bacterium]